MSTVLLLYAVLVECPPAQRPSGRYTGTYRYSYSIGLQFKYTRTSTGQVLVWIFARRGAFRVRTQYSTGTNTVY